MRETIKVSNPVTGETLREVPHDTPEAVRAAVACARVAQAAWAARPFAERAAVTKRFYDLLLKRSDEVMDVIRQETGKALPDAFAELFGLAGEVRYYSYHGETALRPVRAGGAIPLRDRSTVIRKPRGVVGIIAPWNFPLILSVGDAIPALLAGNGVVLKPSEVTPLTALYARELLIEAGLPPDLFGIVNGYGEALAEPLVEAVDYVMFTGSEHVGRIIGAMAGRTLTPCTLELGGKNAMIVLDDANISHAAVCAVHGSFNNAGQVCINWERILVDERVHDAFVEAVLAETARIRVGWSDEADFGSLIHEKQLDRVEQHVDDATSKGARVLAGGERIREAGPAFYAPTVLADITPEMDLYNEETFGPVTAIIKVKGAEEAIRKANDTPYGLHFGVFSRNRRRAQQLAAQLEVGTVSINDTAYTMWGAVDAPMGGIKASGVGRRHGPEGIQHYTYTQTIFVNHTRFQILDGSSPLSINARLRKLLIFGLKIWRFIPFIR